MEGRGRGEGRQREVGAARIPKIGLLSDTQKIMGTEIVENLYYQSCNNKIFVCIVMRKTSQSQ